MSEHEIGSGVVLQWDEDGKGILWKHPGCRAWMTLRFKPVVESTGHVLIAGSPTETEKLTIGGSLLCPAGCGFHGHITNGKWISC